MKPSSFQLRPIHIALLTLVGLLPWAWFQMGMALNTNHAWLFTAAARLLDGGTHFHDVYEPNPPLSIFIYYPSVLISTYFSLAAEYSIYLFGLVALGFSTVALWFFLKPLEAIKETEKALFCALYVVAGCIIPSNLFFAERDEFVVWGLVPFMLAQLMITQGYKFKGAWLYLYLFTSALLILIKPHYIIFPALLFLHRVVIRRDLVGLFRTPDVWAMIMACWAYALTILLFFQDYLTEILPNLIQYYIAYPSDGVFAALPKRMLLSVMLLAAVWFMPMDRIYKRTALAFVVAALLALCLYALQMKGFGYHLIPANMFLFMAGASVVYGVLRTRLAGDGLRVGMLVIALFIAYIVAPLKIHAQTHESYSKLLLPETVRSCGSPCPFFIFAENMEMIWQTSLYTGEAHASRFPGLWWLHSMLEHGYDPADQQKYAGMVAEDLARYDPKMLIIATNLKTVHGETFNFIEFFSNNENFKAQIMRYKLDRKIIDDRGLYFKGTTGEYPFPIEYDVYLRKSSD